LLPKREEWLNGSVANSTGFSPLELTFESPRDLFKKFLKKGADQISPDESLSDKVLKAYIRMKSKASRRFKGQKRGLYKWESQIGDLVLSRCQPVSEALKEVTGKLLRPCEDNWRIIKLIPPYYFEVSGVDGKMRGVFHKQALFWKHELNYVHTALAWLCMAW